MIARKTDACLKIRILTQKIKFLTFSNFNKKAVVTLNAKSICAEALTVDISVAGSSEETLTVG